MTQILSFIIPFSRNKNGLQLGGTRSICNVLHGWSRRQKNEQQNNAPNPKKITNAAAGYKGPVKVYCAVY